MNELKYIPLIIGFLSAVEPIWTEVQAAIAEGKTADPITTKMQKILADAETALQALIKSVA